MASLYCSSKFALEGWSESLAQELLPFGIHVTAIEPGFFRTDFLEASSVRYTDVKFPEYQAGFEQLRAWLDGKSLKQEGRSREVGAGAAGGLLQKTRNPCVYFWAATRSDGWKTGWHATRVSSRSGGRFPVRPTLFEQNCALWVKRFTAVGKTTLFVNCQLGRCRTLKNKGRGLRSGPSAFRLQISQAGMAWATGAALECWAGRAARRWTKWYGGQGAGKLHTAVLHQQAGSGVFVLVALHALVDQSGVRCRAASCRYPYAGR